MTAREHIAGYESKVREYTNFATRGIKNVIKACGPRECGSEAERKAQEMMAKELENVCDSVTLESFKTAPHAFLGWVNLAFWTFFGAAIAFFFGYALISLVLLLAILAVIVLEFLMYKEALDVIYPKKQSQNVVGIRKPEGEVKRRLVLCGHADSAYEWHYTYWGDKYFGTVKLLVAVIALGVCILFVGIAFSIAALAKEGLFSGVWTLGERYGAMQVLSYIFCALCVPLASVLFFKSWKHLVDGANDNLSGCFTAMAVAKLLGDQKLRLKNTELVVVCSGGEECGLRGAKAFAKAHAAEYTDVETAFISLDTMRDFEHMTIYHRDMTGTVKLDDAVCALVRAGGKTAGYDLPYSIVFFGSSDGAAAQQAGIRTAAFAAMDPAPAAYYHTRLDTADNLDPKTLEASIDIMLEVTYQFDTTGLAPFEGAVVKTGG
ncbi:MAG: Zn-dependent exopeptidase M28 [Oscillospiraceae bacterium]|jgi:hypothetical protein|nr:Zn-dependent exopeptidase M28 [Oscillospiraceae bacterium]